MYRIGRGVRKSRKRHLKRTLILVAMAVLAAVGYFAAQFRYETNESTQPEITIGREYARAEVDNRKLFDETDFSFKLPGDWILKERQSEPYNMYLYQATAKNADNRWLEIYIDKTPTEKPLNRLQPAKMIDNKISADGKVSDNCYNEIEKKTAVNQTFQGVNFKCDTNNTTRNIIGVGMPGAGTTIRANGHNYMIFYTDHNAHPDYAILQDMLESMKFK